MGSLCSRIIGSDSRNVNVGYTLLYIAYIAYIAYTLFFENFVPVAGQWFKGVFLPFNCTHFWGATVPIFGGQLYPFLGGNCYHF